MTNAVEPPSPATRRERTRVGARIDRARTAVGVVSPLLLMAAVVAYRTGALAVAIALAALVVAAIAAVIWLNRVYRRTAGSPGHWRDLELISERHDEVPVTLRVLYRLWRPWSR